MSRLFSAPLRKLDDDVFDFVVDFPDPSKFTIGKLYSAAFYRLLEKNMSVGALAVIQSTSPLYARQSFWRVSTPTLTG